MATSQNGLLAGLSPSDFSLIEPHLKLVDLPTGKILIDADEEIAEIHFPFQGVVSMLNVLHDGSQVECCTMGNETGFGLMAAQEPCRSYTRDIIQIPGEGAVMSARALRGAYSQSISLATVIHRHIRTVWGFMAQCSACNARHKVEARLCRWLLTCADYVAENRLPLRQEFIAAMLGVQRTSVAAAAAGLQHHAIIRVMRGKVEILDREALRQRSCECYEITRRRIDQSLGRVTVARQRAP